MIAGALALYDAWRLTLTTTPDLSGPVDISPTAGGSIFTRYIIDVETIAVGLMINHEVVRNASNPLGLSTVTFSIPSLLIEEVWTLADSEAGVTAYIELVNYKIYSKSGTKYVETWTGINMYVNGSLHTTAPGGSIENLHLVAGGIPLIGMPAQIEAGGGTMFAIVLPPALVLDNFDFYGECTSTGGWQFKQGGVWYPLTVTLVISDSSHASLLVPDPSIVSNTMDGYAYAKGGVFCSAVFDSTVTCYCTAPNVTILPTIADIYDCEIYTYSRGCTSVLIPDLPKEVLRMTPAGYQDAIIKGAFPKTTRVKSVIDTNDIEGSFTTTFTEVHPRQSPVLFTANNTTHAAEDTFGYASYAFYGRYGYIKKSTGQLADITQYGVCAAPPPEPDEPPPPDPGPPAPCWTLGTTIFNWKEYIETFGTVENRVDYSDLSEILDVNDPIDTDSNDLARYMNTWVTPHWSYFGYWPTDLAEEAAPTAWEWTVDGARANPSEYWIPARTQWPHHSALPAGENRERRNSQISSPLLEGKFANYIRSYFTGQYSSWWGITRWKTDKPVIPASTTLGTDSEPGWSSVDCTFTISAGQVHVTPTKLTCSVEYDIGSFSIPPYMLTKIAKKIEATWDADVNIVLIRVLLVNQWGDVITLLDGTNNAAAPVDIPSGKDSKYFGSYGQDFGVGFISTDAGSDTRPQGVSTSAMTNPETVAFLNAHAARMPAKLRYEIQVVAASGVLDIDLPTFYAPVAAWVSVPENGHWQSLLWPEGPMMRYGQWLWLIVSPYQLLVTPEVWEIGTYPFGYKCTALDYLCARRVVFNGLARNDGLVTEVTALWDTYELTGTGSAPSDEDAIISADGFTTSFVLPNALGFAMVNSLNELPPLAVLPVRERNANMQPTGDWVQHSHSYCIEPMQYVSPVGKDLRLYEPPIPTLKTAVSGTYAVLGYVINEFGAVVNNEEDALWKVRYPNINYGLASPWHGYVYVNNAGATGETFGVAFDYDMHKANSHSRMVLDEFGDVQYGKADNYNISWVDDLSELSTEWMRINYDSLNTKKYLYILHGDGDNVYLSRSLNGGKTLVDTMTIGAGSFADMIAGTDGNIYIYRNDAGTIKFKMLDKQLNVVKSGDTNIVNADVGSGVAVCESFISAGWRMGLLYRVSGVITFLTSNDRLTFS